MWKEMTLGFFLDFRKELGSVNHECHHKIWQVVQCGLLLEQQGLCRGVLWLTVHRLLIKGEQTPVQGTRRLTVMLQSNVVVSQIGIFWKSLCNRFSWALEWEGEESSLELLMSLVTCCQLLEE